MATKCNSCYNPIMDSECINYASTFVNITTNAAVTATGIFVPLEIV